jgi:hypothetical protein
VSSPTRRAFLKTIGQAGLFCAVPSIARSAAALNGPPSPGYGAASDTIQISILHTTDLQGHILPTTDYQGNADLGGFARQYLRFAQRRSPLYETSRFARNARNKVHVSSGPDPRCND